MPETGGPLAGVRVIDLTLNVLGPFATQLLGDAGAEVIKIEPPGGDPLRHVGPSRTPGMGAMFANLNRNKRSVQLDLKGGAGRAALLRLIAGADVFVHNMRLAAAARLGLDHAALAPSQPRLVYAAATGFRKDGPLRDRPAYDDIVQGLSGLASLNGGPDAAPRYVPAVIADKIAGQALATAVTMALFHRERSGAGQEVHVPMLETMLAFTLVEHMWGATLGEPGLGLGYPRVLTRHRRPYATQDGHICVVANTDAQWRRLFAVIGRPHLAEDPRFATAGSRMEHIDTLYGMLAEAFAGRPTAVWLGLLEAADVPCGRVNTLADLFADDYLRETGFFQEAEHPTAGRMTMLPIPTAFSRTPATIRALPPALGADTEAVLREAGLSTAEIAAARGAAPGAA